MRAKFKSKEEVIKIYESRGIEFFGDKIYLKYKDDENLAEDYNWEDFPEFSYNSQIVNVEQISQEETEESIDSVWIEYFPTSKWFTISGMERDIIFPEEVLVGIKEKLDAILNEC